ncbi:MAG: hypothetical protein U0350_27990 [Caldilineaceae bacterium]
MNRNKANYPGYHPQDYQTNYAKYFVPEPALQPSTEVALALQKGSLAPDAIPPLDRVTTMLHPGYADVENGYTLEADGSARLAILTPMPNVTPLMWHWWFGWHGDQTTKYKLWHPKAHVSAAWKDGEVGKVAYIDRTSYIQEYIGKTLEKAAIQFIAPTTLQLSEASEREVFICARVGFVDFPLNYGWLVHQVRTTEKGAEMRSRFWIGGKHIHFKTANRLGEIASRLVQKFKKVAPQQAIDLVVHCSEEMTHLATFLPALYAEFSNT